MRQKVDQQYNDWLKTQRKRRNKKLFGQIAAGLILVFLMSSTVAGAFDYNLIQIATDWGKDTFHLSVQNQPNGQNDNINKADRKTFASIEEVFKDVAAKPLLPGWVPDGFAFKYAEKFSRSDNTNVVLYYQNNSNEVIVFDYSICTDKAAAGTSFTKEYDFEKDDSMVEVYEKDNLQHYIFQNLDRVQAVWNRAGLGGGGTDRTARPAVPTSRVGSSAFNVWCRNQSTTYYNNYLFNWSWDNVAGFFKLIKESTSSAEGPYGLSSYSNGVQYAIAGNVLGVDWDGSPAETTLDHAMFVTQVTGAGGSRTKDDVKIAAHTRPTNSAYETLSSYTSEPIGSFGRSQVYRGYYTVQQP